MTARADDGGGAAASGELRRAGAVWEDLEALAATEALAVAEGRFDELPALYEQRAALLVALPSPLPSEAVEPLRRALAVQRATASALMARRDAIGTELAKLDRGRTGVRGYARTL